MIMHSTRRSPVFLFLVLTACLSRSSPQTQGAVNAPPIPADLNLPETDVLTAPAPDDSEVLYYRNLVLVAFDDTLSGGAIREFFARYHAVIIGGADFVGPRGGYLLQIPDPGPSLECLDAVLKKIEKEPGVAEATWLTYKDRFTPLGTEVSTPRRPHQNWPLLTELPDLDTSRMIVLPGDSFAVFRTDLSLTFKPAVSDSAKAAFFALHSIRVVGVTPVGRFFVRIADPGLSPHIFLQTVAELRAQPEVAGVGWIPRETHRTQ